MVLDHDETMEIFDSDRNEKIKVTAIEANYCSGSSMFFFQGDFLLFDVLFVCLLKTVLLFLDVEFISFQDLSGTCCTLAFSDYVPHFRF